MAGRDWVEGFLKRNPTLRLRQSAPTSLARAIGFNKIQVCRFYQNLAELNQRYNFRPNRIYNMDETGMSTVPKKTPKVVSVRGKKVVGKLVSAERGITVTAICCMSATGHFIPPAFIYPRKRPKGELLEEGPIGSVCMVSDSGYINTNLFSQWLYHFKDYSHPIKEYPILLIIDNHSSHINLEATNYARDHGIVILTLPPHSSHKIQPLDRSFFSPLKTKYAIECDKWMTQHPGRGITQYQVARLFNIAYKQVATMSNAESGFKVSGIFPFDDDLFDESDFAPASVTDQILNYPDEEIYGEPPVAPVSPIVTENATSQPPSISKVTEQNSTNQFSSVTVTEQCTSLNTKCVSISELSPLPRMSERKRRTKSSLRSEIITSSPFKEQLEEKAKADSDKMARKNIKKPVLRSLSPQPSPSQKIKTSNSDPKEAKCQKKNKDIFCPLCKEQFVEHPTEEWIQCASCEEWWHEQCTAYEHGTFICDICEENTK
ncbi:hypothetical protein NQ318_022279 [Aromia moschata]|uniref:DDE-1 domain-containing protein n=1 Tax=Aromia moschata TaxID=1265417 RepID=A0AAV8Z4W7_9CUCU|nr:hypothetical protein NQ318_022279 [Aromia moschata]